MIFRSGRIIFSLFLSDGLPWACEWQASPPRYDERANGRLAAHQGLARTWSGGRVVGDTR